MRVVNRLAALLLGLVLVAGGLLMAVQAAVAAAGRAPWPVRFDTWYGPLRRIPLTDPLVLAAAIVVALLGALLLVVQLRRPVPRALAVHGADGADWWVHRRAAEREITAAVDRLVGVQAGGTRLRGRRRRWRVRVTATARPDARPQVAEAVRGQLERFAAPEPVKTRIVLRRPRRVV